MVEEGNPERKLITQGLGVLWDRGQDKDWIWKEDASSCGASLTPVLEGAMDQAQELQDSLGTKAGEGSGDRPMETEDSESAQRAPHIPVGIVHTDGVI